MQRLRLLSYNIQAGIATGHYHHYLTGSWKHLLPDPKRQDNLDRIALVLKDFDIVGIQEADAGSLRTGNINLTQYLAEAAHFPHWYDYTNRNIGRVAQHSLGLLSRFKADCVEGHSLPGPRGRGALCAHFGEGENGLVLIILHLALGHRARMRQLEFLHQQSLRFPNLVVMGDMNFRRHSREMIYLHRHAGLVSPGAEMKTFPSWKPRRSIDHILVSRSLQILGTRVLQYPISDHLPLCMELQLPDGIVLHAQKSDA